MEAASLLARLVPDPQASDVARGDPRSTWLLLGQGWSMILLCSQCLGQGPSHNGPNT